MSTKTEYNEVSVDWVINQVVALTRYAAALDENMSGIDISLHPEDGLILNGCIHSPHGVRLPFGESLDDPIKSAQLTKQLV